MSARTIAVLVAIALFALGVGGALWAADAFRAPDSSSVDLIELDRDDVLYEPGETDKKKDRKKDRGRPRKGGGANRDSTHAPSGGSDDSSGGAHVVHPPPPEEAGDDDDEVGDEDGEGRDD